MPIDDEVRPIALDRRVSEIARSLVSPPARSAVDAGRHRRRRADRLRDRVRVRGAGVEGRAGRSRSDRPRQHRTGRRMDRRRSGRLLRRGREGARAARPRGTPGRSWRRAALDFAALLRRLDIKCALEPQGAAIVALTPRAGGAAEARAARRGATRASTRRCSTRARSKGELGLDAAAAIREPRGASVDPYRACLGLAAAAAERGARSSSDRRCGRSSSAAGRPTCITAGGAIRTRSRRRRDRRADARSSSRSSGTSGFARRYLALTERVPAKIRQQLGRRDDGRARLGASRRTSSGGWTTSGCSWPGADAPSPPVRQREKIVVQRTGQLMYELSTIYPDISGILPEYGWDAPYARTGGRPAVHRPASQFPASSVRVRRFEPQRDRRVPREPHPAAAPPRRARTGRRGHFGFTPTWRLTCSSSAASRRSRNRPGRHDRAACGARLAASGCAI